MKHTQGPWEVLNNYIKVRGGAVIATTARNNSVCNFAAGVASLEDAANAEFIVRACNSHYELLEALKSILRSSKRGTRLTNHDKWIISFAENAIQKVEGGSHE